MVAKTNTAEVTAPETGEDLKPLYLEAVSRVERLHRRLLDLIKDEFDRMGWDDINPVQALLMFNIGDAELTAGELRSRGYYLGSNVSYNLKKLVETGYIFQERSRADRRSVRIRLTPKGEEVAEVIDELYDRHLKSIDKVGGLGEREFQTLNKALGPSRALLGRPDPVQALGFPGCGAIGLRVRAATQTPSPVQPSRTGDQPNAGQVPAFLICAANIQYRTKPIWSTCRTFGEWSLAGERRLPACGLEW